MFQNENKIPTGWELVVGAWEFLNAVFDHAAPAMAEHGLHQKSLVLLALLDKGDTPQQLAHLLRTPAPTLSHMLKELEGRGLIARSLDAADRRRFRLRRTAAGDRALAAGVAAINEAASSRLACLSDAEREVVAGAVLLLPRLTGD
jgi:DNA-binding MarR family transcriptional regulator